MYSREHELCCMCGAELGRGDARTCENSQCQIGYQRILELEQSVCVVCGRPLPLGISPRVQPTCGAMTCLLQAAQVQRAKRKGAATCQACHVLLPVQKVARGYCDDRTCATIAAHHRARQREMQREASRREFESAATSRRLELAETHKIDNVEEFLIVLVPHTSKPLSSPSTDRLGALLAHIRHLIQRAVVAAPDPGDFLRPESDYLPEATEAESQAFGVGCRLCRGHCCVAGGTHAFLTISTIRRVFANQPDLSPMQVFEAYTSRIPEKSVEDSCLFHGQFGCTLPRDMRADMCNRFLCRDLQDMRLAMAESNQRFFVAAHDASKMVDAEFVDLDAAASESTL